MKTVLKMFVAASLFGLVNTSCKKEMEDTFGTDQLVAVDQNQAENEADDVGNIEDQTLEANASATGRVAVEGVLFDSSSCAQVTITPRQIDGNGGLISKGKIIIDFKDGCMCKDGRMRKGKIISEFTNRLRVPGAVVTTSFLGYGVTKKGGSEYVLFDEGCSKTTTNTSIEPMASPNHAVMLKRDVVMNLTLPGGAKISHTGTRNVKWELFDLSNRWDNVFTIFADGSNQTGIDRKGRSYTLTVDKDLVRKAECAYKFGVYKPVSGQVTIKHENKTKVVDFGSGTCDNTVEVTINGKKTRTRW